MTPRNRNDLHLKQVEAWKRKNNVSEKEMPLLLINGILAVHRKSLSTLSGVTVTAVIDRILLECQERFSVLAEISNDSQGLNFNKFSDRIFDYDPKEVQEALEEFLLELLEVFGKITAEILTKTLHQELMTVGLSTKNRDKK